MNFSSLDLFLDYVLVFKLTCFLKRLETFLVCYDISNVLSTSLSVGQWLVVVICGHGKPISKLFKGR